ncbi:MAG TPA: hypothetical protein VFL51_03375 [Pseudolabrys sp.]|nr:hypothetical protein [Pseudolabrys sp.]
MPHGDRLRGSVAVAPGAGCALATGAELTGVELEAPFGAAGRSPAAGGVAA